MTSPETVSSLLAPRFASQLSGVLESMTGERVRCTATETEPLLLGSEHLCVHQKFTDAGYEAWVVSERAQAIELGSRMLKAAGIADGDETGARSTYLEVIGQAFSGVARMLSATAGHDISCTEATEDDPPPGTESSTVEISIPGSSTLRLSIAFLRERVASKGDHGSTALCRTTQADGDAAEVPKTLALLLDVELPVSLSFGSAQLPLRDVVKLTTGSIVELNRTISEPVDVIVNNCVIAKGEVVVVDGNFAVRIQHVASRQERLRTVS